MKWYRKAADAGNADAMTSIGVLYHNGEGVTRDYGEAMKWFRKDADAGYADAGKLLQAPEDVHPDEDGDEFEFTFDDDLWCDLSVNPDPPTARPEDAPPGA